MASKGNKRHIKRIAASGYAGVSRKKEPYLIKPNAGRYRLSRSIALLVVLREKLGIASTGKEARKIIRLGHVEVNGKVIKDERYPLGLNDVLHIKQTGESYVIHANRNGVVTLEALKDSGKRILKVIDKYTAKGNKPMIRLYDGSAAANSEAKPNDSVVLKEGKIEKVLHLQPGAKCLVTEGTHTSQIGTLTELRKGSATTNATVMIDSNGEVFETLLENIMVVGE